MVKNDDDATQFVRLIENTGVNVNSIHEFIFFYSLWKISITQPLGINNISNSIHLSI
jgi:hypothetical protein